MLEVVTRVGRHAATSQADQARPAGKIAAIAVIDGGQGLIGWIGSTHAVGP
jgi:hypothetical protein